MVGAETGEKHAEDLQVCAYAKAEAVDVAGSIRVPALSTKME